MKERITVSIAGASGYVGGELLRLWLDHPYAEVKQITSERRRGSAAHFAHPNLRGRTSLKFASLNDLEPADLLCLCLPHGAAMQRMDELTALGTYVLDCSADFRLPDAETYRRWYGQDHAAPAWLDRFVYGLPETHREAIRSARYLTGVGCNATAITLALLPLFQAGLPLAHSQVICEVKVGSSEAGNKANDGSHHPERAQAMRSFAPVGHRHTAEVQQALALYAATPSIHMSATAIDNVRGALATAHVFLETDVTEKDIWRAYRQAYRAEPFLRLVKGVRGIHRLPEPKILAGSNYADVGFAWDPASGRVVSL